MEYNFYLGEEITEDSHTDLNIFPNPSSGQFTIGGTGYLQSLNGSELELTVLDNQGRLIRTETYYGDETVSINLSGQGNGIYFVRIVSGDHCYTLKAILIN